MSGVNNDLGAALGLKGYISAVFAFDPESVAGEAPPYLGNLTKGTQLWYGVIVPSSKYVIERLEVVDFDQDGRNEISVWTSSGEVFYLTFDGAVRRIARSDGGDAKAGAQFRLVRD